MLRYSLATALILTLLTSSNVFADAVIPTDIPVDLNKELPATYQTATSLLSDTTLLLQPVEMSVTYGPEVIYVQNYRAWPMRNMVIWPWWQRPHWRHYYPAPTPLWGPRYHQPRLHGPIYRPIIYNHRTGYNRPYRPYNRTSHTYPNYRTPTATVYHHGPAPGVRHSSNHQQPPMPIGTYQNHHRR